MGSAQYVQLHLDVPIKCTNLSHRQRAATTVLNASAQINLAAHHIWRQSTKRPNGEGKNQCNNVSKEVETLMFLDRLPSKTDLNRDAKPYTTWQVVLAFDRPDHSMDQQSIQSIAVLLHISVVVHTENRLYRQMAMRW